MATSAAKSNVPYELDLVVPKGLQDLFPANEANASLGYATPTAPGLVSGGVDLGSGYTVGLLQAMQIITQSLSAITANIGNLVMADNGSIAIGETAYAVGAGIWLGIDASGNPQFSIQDKNGNFINIAMTSGGVLGISSSGISGALTSKQVDDQGWRNTGVWNQVSGTPTTRAGYNITDAQATLPNASTPGQVLQRDNGGSPYFAPKYGSETNCFSQNLTGPGFTANALVQLGNTLGISKPSVTTGLVIIGAFNYAASVGNCTGQINLEYSHDGGATWSIAESRVGLAALTTENKGATLMGSALPLGTSDFQIRVRCLNSSGINTFNVVGDVFAILCPNNLFYIIAGALAGSIPTTGSGNCTATYPTTTCTASEQVMVTPTGGTPPYTFLWSVVSGTGTITAGSTSQTCTVSDTETATTGGANFNTTVKCVVTDSVPNNATSNNDVITNTFTLVYSAITATVSTTNGTCSNSTCGNVCTATGSATANPSGGNGSYTYSWSVVSGTGTIVGGSTSQSVSVHDTEATSQPFPWTTSNTLMQCSVNDTRGTGAVTPQGTVHLTFKCPTI